MRRFWMASLTVMSVLLAAGCGSSQQNVSIQPSSVPAGPCRTALTRFQALQQDLSKAEANPSDSAADGRANEDAQRLSTAVSGVASMANGDQKALLSQFQAVLRDLENTLTAAASHSLTGAKTVLQGVAAQVGGLSGLIVQVCKR